MKRPRHEERLKVALAIQNDIIEINKRVGTGGIRARIRAELLRRGIPEGSATLDEIMCLYDLAKGNGSRSVGQTGFNAGYSALGFLYAHPDTTLVSFDILEYAYVAVAQDYIEEKFPNRHVLVAGDSRGTVPHFKEEHPEIAFDTIFIDGGHEYPVAKADLFNMRVYAHEGTDVVMDDMTPWKKWGAGPTQAWNEAIEGGIMEHHGLNQDGKRVSEIDKKAQRAWAQGRYILPPWRTS